MQICFNRITQWGQADRAQAWGKFSLLRVDQPDEPTDPEPFVFVVLPTDRTAVAVHALIRQSSASSASAADQVTSFKSTTLCIVNRAIITSQRSGLRRRCSANTAA